MYGKHFTSMYTGSMMGAGPVVFAVWGYVISHCNNAEVELNPRLVATLIGCSVGDVETAIEFLLQEDPQSRNTEENGRRLIKVGQFAYRVVSHALYRSIRDENDRREYNRKKQAEYREAKRVPPCTAVYRGVAQSAQAEAEADITAGAVIPPEQDQSPKETDAVPWGAIVDAVDGVTGTKSRWTAKRKVAAKARWADKYWRENWREAVERAAGSSFLTGQNDRGWVMDLEFFLRPDTVTKILEGKYDDREITRPEHLTANQHRERNNANAFDTFRRAADSAIASGALGSTDTGGARALVLGKTND